LLFHFGDFCYSCLQFSNCSSFADWDFSPLLSGFHLALASVRGKLSFGSSGIGFFSHLGVSNSCALRLVVFVAVGSFSEVVVVVGLDFSPSSLFAVVVGLFGASLLSSTCLQYAATSFD